MPDAEEGRSSRAGQVVTFYSFKGGTGRTMALANVAWILAANGKRVLIADWDLESPGLHRFFQPFMDTRAVTGPASSISSAGTPGRWWMPRSTPRQSTVLDGPGRPRSRPSAPWSMSTSADWTVMSSR